MPSACYLEPCWFVGSCKGLVVPNVCPQSACRCSPNSLQLFHQPLSVLLLAPGTISGDAHGRDSLGGREPEPAAVVSRSNRQLRAALDLVGASYTMAASAAPGGAKRQAPAGGDAPAAPAQSQQPNAADGRAGSQLLIRGGRGVQALHLLLLQQACTGEGSTDVPVLLAPVPFAGAALCPCVLKVGRPGFSFARECSTCGPHT